MSYVELIDEMKNVRAQIRDAIENDDDRILMDGSLVERVRQLEARHALLLRDNIASTQIGSDYVVNNLKGETSVGREMSMLRRDIESLIKFRNA
jgi:hypothetical protein